jgi:hypothetical protein
MFENLEGLYRDPEGRFYNLFTANDGVITVSTYGEKGIKGMKGFPSIVEAGWYLQGKRADRVQ